MLGTMMLGSLEDPSFPLEFIDNACDGNFTPLLVLLSLHSSKRSVISRVTSFPSIISSYGIGALRGILWYLTSIRRNGVAHCPLGSRLGTYRHGVRFDACIPQMALNMV